MHVIAPDVLSLIGKTPLVRLARFHTGKGAVIAKLESKNPSGSVKDRAALAMVLSAEKDGSLARGGHIVEATSGNTGIALAMICAVRGYACTIVMPDDASAERRKILRAYGANVVLTPFQLGMRAAVDKANSIAAENKAFMPSQFDNDANPRAHEEHTAEEILGADLNVGAFVSGVGTGGTITGVGRALKRATKGAVRIIAIEPDECAVLSGGDAGPHGIFGLGAGFIPRVLDRTVIDEVIRVTESDALAGAARLARTEGILSGPSSGANVFVAAQIADRLATDVVTVICDLGERYLAE